MDVACFEVGQEVDVGVVDAGLLQSGAVTDRCDLDVVTLGLEGVGDGAFVGADQRDSERHSYSMVAGVCG